jgi:hypothetical protein
MSLQMASVTGLTCDFRLYSLVASDSFENIAVDLCLQYTVLYCTYCCFKTKGYLLVKSTIFVEELRLGSVFETKSSWGISHVKMALLSDVSEAVCATVIRIVVNPDDDGGRDSFQNVGSQLDSYTADRPRRLHYIQSPGCFIA